MAERKVKERESVLRFLNNSHRLPTALLHFLGAALVGILKTLRSGQSACSFPELVLISIFTEAIVKVEVPYRKWRDLAAQSSVSIRRAW